MNKLQLANNTALTHHKTLPIHSNEITIPSIIISLFSNLESTITDDKYTPPFIGNSFPKIERPGKSILLSEDNNIDDFIDATQPLLKQLAILIHEKHLIPNNMIKFNISEKGVLEIFTSDLDGIKKPKEHTTKSLVDNYTLILMRLLYKPLEQTPCLMIKSKGYKFNISDETHKKLMQRITKELENYYLPITEQHSIME